MNQEEQGTVIEVRPKALYRVRLVNGQVITAGLSSPLRHAVLRLLVGDQVKIRLSTNDPHRGQITRKAG
jgi:translation initiation factor IF-1